MQSKNKIGAWAHMRPPFHKKMIFLIFLLKTLVVGTRKNHLAEAVLKSTHNLCFGPKQRTPVLLHKNGAIRGINYTDMFS